MGEVDQIGKTLGRRRPAPWRTSSGGRPEKVPSCDGVEYAGASALFQRGRVSVVRKSDPELPESVGFAVAPGGPAGDGILQGADHFASGGVKEGLGVDFNDIEAHVVGVEQGCDSLGAEGFGEVQAEKPGFLSPEKKEGGHLAMIGFRPDERGNGIVIPSSV